MKKSIIIILIFLSFNVHGVRAFSLNEKVFVDLVDYNDNKYSYEFLSDLDFEALGEIYIDVELNYTQYETQMISTLSDSIASQDKRIDVVSSRIEKINTQKFRKINKDINLQENEYKIYSLFPYFRISSTDMDIIDTIEKIANFDTVRSKIIYENRQASIQLMCPGCYLDEEEDTPTSNTYYYDNYPESTTLTGEGVKIGILDPTYLYADHPNFLNTSFTDLSDDPYELWEGVWEERENNHEIHGTAMMSIISGTHGYAPDAEIVYLGTRAINLLDNLNTLGGEGV